MANESTWKAVTPERMCPNGHLDGAGEARWVARPRRRKATFFNTFQEVSYPGLQSVATITTPTTEVDSKVIAVAARPR
jgi:hypothetical protein